MIGRTLTVASSLRAHNSVKNATIIIMYILTWGVVHRYIQAVQLGIQKQDIVEHATKDTHVALLTDSVTLSKLLYL